MLQAEVAHSVDDPLLTTSDVARRLKVIDETVLRLLRAGDLRGFKVGAAWRVYQSDLENFIEANANW